GGQGHDMASPSMTKTGARPACNARQTARRKKSSTSPEQNCGDHVEGGSGFHAGSGRKERAYTDTRPFARAGRTGALGISMKTARAAVANGLKRAESRADPLGTNTEVGRKLKQYYDELISEAVPDRFQD